MNNPIKSVHIKEFWPYEYVEPVKMTRRERDKARYLRKKAASVKTPKSEGSKRLLRLPVYSMSESFCERLNNDPQSRK